MFYAAGIIFFVVGPCALDFTKIKTMDHFWTDPSADELVQRHRIHTGGMHAFSTPNSPKRPGLQACIDSFSSNLIGRSLLWHFCCE